MSAYDFADLEAFFDEIVAIMPPKFDSHDFILRLAQQHQREYIEALAADADVDHPFQFVHGEIAKRLKKRTDLVENIGKRNSPDIFGEVCAAALWRKLAWESNSKS